MRRSTGSARAKPNTLWTIRRADGRVAEKIMVQGRGDGGRMIQVVYVIDDDGTVFIVHAMPLTTRRRRGRRR